MQELRGFPVNIIVKTENIQGEPAHDYFIGLLEHIANITHSFHGAGRRAPSYGGGETPGRHHGRNLRGEALGSDAGGILVGVVLLLRRESQAQLQGHMHWWIGYRLHIDWADNILPLTAVTTYASVHDSYEKTCFRSVGHTDG